MDQQGRQVLKLSPVDGSPAILKGISGITSPNGRTLQFDFDFKHSDIENAFEEFDELAEKRFEEIKKEQLEQRKKIVKSEDSGIILPGNSRGMPPTPKTGL